MVAAGLLSEFGELTIVDASLVEVIVVVEVLTSTTTVAVCVFRSSAISAFTSQVQIAREMTHPTASWQRDKKYRREERGKVKD